MFKRLLVPLDGSENAERALPWVREYARDRKATVVLVRVVTPEEGATGEAVREARHYLEQVGLDLAAAGIVAKPVVRAGKAAPVLAETARVEKCDLVIMPTRGGSKVLRWLVGGVTEQVMRLVSIPVLVLRSQVPLARQGKIGRILVPLDGSRAAEGLLAWSEHLARFHRAPIVMLHTLPEETNRGEEDAFDSLRERATFYSDRMKKRGLRAAFKVRTGDAAEQILRAARPTDLIAMTTHGRGGFKRWVFGSVAEKVIHEARVPVLIFKGHAPARVLLPVANG